MTDTLTLADTTITIANNVLTIADADGVRSVELVEDADAGGEWIARALGGVG